MTNNHPRGNRAQEAPASSAGFCFKITILLVLGLGVAIATMPIFNFKKPIKAGYYK